MAGADFQGYGWGSGTGRLSTDFTDGTDFFGVLGVSCWQMVPMPQIPEGLASLPRCSIRVHPCHPWLVNPVHERGWTTDLTDGHGSEARELSADDGDGADFQGCGWGSGTGRLSTDFTDDTDSGPRFEQPRSDGSDVGTDLRLRTHATGRRAYDGRRRARPTVTTRSMIWRRRISTSGPDGNPSKANAPQRRGPL